MRLRKRMFSPKKILLFIPVILLCGCTGGLKTPTDSIQKALADKIPSGNLFVAGDYDKKQPLSVAILPFDNQTKEPKAAALLRRLFYNNFSSLAYQDIELATVDAALNGFNPTTAFESADAAAIAPKLKADAVIMGRVTQFETLYAGLYASFTVGFELKMISAKDNEVLWSVKHQETQRSGKVPLSPIGLIIAAASTVMDLSHYNMINTSNKLCRVSIDSIPPSAALKGQSYPRIFTLAHDGVNRILKKGDQLQVGIEGSPGLTANFIIVPKNTPITMQEKEAGSYIGVYTVREGDELADGQIVVTLTDEWHNNCRWEDTLGLVNLDGIPPDPPTGIKASAADQKIALRWNSSTSKDLAGYQILRSLTPLSGFEEAGFTEFTRFEEANLQNGTTYFYRVIAKDKAGNLSQTMAGIPVTPVPPGPTLISGDVGPDTVWHPGGNPYFFDGEVTLPQGGRLRIEPGVLIKVADTTRFLVQGQLIVDGEANAPVVFTSDHEGGTWEGIVFDHSDAEGTLSHFEITKAITGIRIVNASPAIASGTIKECRTGMIISGEKAAPQIKTITVYRNETNGISVSDLAQPRMVGSTIAYNGTAGLELLRSGGKFLGNEISYNQIGVQMSQTSSILAGNRIQYNTAMDLKSEATALAALKIDLNYFGPPQEIVAQSTHPDHAKNRLALLASSDWRGPKTRIALSSFPQKARPTTDQTLWIRGNSTQKGKTETEKNAAPPEKPAKQERPAVESSTSKNTTGAENVPSREQKQSVSSPEAALDAFLQGVDLARKEAYPEAIALLTKALKESSREAEVRFWLGFCYLQTGEIKQALYNYNQAVKLAPRNTEYLLQLGSALHLSNEKAKAEVVYREVLRRDPDNQDAKTFLKLLEESRQ